MPIRPIRIQPLDPQPAKIVIDGSLGGCDINHLVLTEEQARSLAEGLQEALADIAAKRAVRRTISYLTH